MKKKYQVLIFFLFLVLIYSHTFQSVPIGDDYLRIFNLKGMFDQGLINVLTNIMPDRPILYLSIYVDYLISGFNPVIFKTSSFIIHFLTSISVYYLFVGINRQYKHLKDERMLQIAMVLFSVIAGNSFATMSIIQRGVELSILFGNLFIILHLIYRETRDRRYQWLSFLCLVISVYTKQIGMFYIVLLAFFIEKREKESLKSRIKELAIYFIPIATCIWLYIGVGNQNSGSQGSMPTLEYFYYQVSTTFIYLKSVFVPTDLRFFCLIDNVPALEQPMFYLAIMFHIFFIGLILYFKKRDKFIFKVGIATYLCFAPESSFLVIKHVMFFHRFNFPSMFFSLFVILVLSYFIKNKKIFLSVVSILILINSIFLFKNIKRNETYEGFSKTNYSYNSHDLSVAVVYASTLIRGKKEQEIIKMLDKDVWRQKELKPLHDIFSMISVYKKKNKAEQMNTIKQMIIYLKSNNTYLFEKTNGGDLYLIVEFIQESLVKQIPDVNYQFKKIDELYRIVFNQLILAPQYYSRIIRKHIGVLLVRKKTLEGEELVRVNGYLFCYGITKSKDLLKGLTDSERKIGFSFIKYCTNGISNE